MDKLVRHSDPTEADIASDPAFGTLYTSDDAETKSRGNATTTAATTTAFAGVMKCHVRHKTRSFKGTGEKQCPPSGLDRSSDAKGSTGIQNMQ